MRIRSVHLFVVALLVVLPLLAGCTHRTKVREGNRDRVSGVVTLDGKPLTGGSVTFISVKNPTYMTTATIRDGKFSIDNAPTGECRATVETESMRGGPPGQVNRYVPIPEKYRFAETSGLTVTILKGQPEGTKLAIELKSK